MQADYINLLMKLHFKDSHRQKAAWRFGANIKEL